MNTDGNTEDTGYFFDLQSNELLEVPAGSSRGPNPNWIPLKSRDHFMFLKQERKYGKTLKLQGKEVISVPSTSKQGHPFEVIRQTVLSSLHIVLTERANLLGYGTIDEVVQFADESADHQFQVEGRSFRRWRALCRRSALDYANELFQSKSTMLPRRAELEARLPSFEIQPDL